MYQPAHFIHNLTQRPRQTVAVRRDKPFDDITEEEIEQVLTSVSGVPDIAKHECWWVSGDFCIRALDAPVYRAIEWDDHPYAKAKDVDRSGWVCMVDVSQRTHCCEVTPSYLLEPLYAFAVGGTDEANEAAYDSLMGGADYESFYVHCHVVDARTKGITEPADGRGLNGHPGHHDDARKTRDHEWEEQREAWNSNCPL